MSTSNQASKKGKRPVNVNPRHSVCFHETDLEKRNEDIQRLIDFVVYSESEEEDQRPGYVITESSQSNMKNNTLEQKIDYLIEIIKSKQSKLTSLDNSCTCQFKYQSLYFSSQKEIEILTQENHKLALKLENLLGKLEVVCLL
ncbi:hypothetical protein Patl1_18273 [Pistacia atlantica]|uniref:Uncharacterized protein n=1 Tax=Pistacia atlantica TaxID=434234 RepID=A0ACC1BZG2_9ROSI|nr:hypothetical protein Patl1_18273 [Pistacia atlantica]